MYILYRIKCHCTAIWWPSVMHVSFQDATDCTSLGSYCSFLLPRQDGGASHFLSQQEVLYVLPCHPVSHFIVQRWGSLISPSEPITWRTQSAMPSCVWARGEPTRKSSRKAFPLLHYYWSSLSFCHMAIYNIHKCTIANRASSTIVQFLCPKLVFLFLETH